MTAISRTQSRASRFSNGQLSLAYSAAAGFTMMGGLLYTTASAIRFGTMLEGSQESVMAFAPEFILPVLVSVFGFVALSSKAQKHEEADLKDHGQGRDPSARYHATLGREGMMAIGLLAGFAAGFGYMGLVLDPQLKVIRTAQESRQQAATPQPENTAYRLTFPAP